MQIHITNATTLDAFVRRIAPHTKLSVSRLKTVFAKGFDYPHIKAFEAALNAQPAAVVSSQGADELKSKPESELTLSSSDSYVIEQLVLWLEDNVGQGTDIAFDNDGEVFSEHALSALENLIAMKTITTHGANVEAETLRFQGIIADYDAKSGCLNTLGLDSEDELESEHWDQMEDAAENLLNDISCDPELAKAIAILNATKLGSISQYLLRASRLSTEMDYLKDRV